MLELEEKIKTLWDNGESIDKIARQLNQKRFHTIKKIKEMRENGILKACPRNTNKRISTKVLTLWENGVKNPYEIAEKLNTNKRQVYISLTAYGIKLGRPKRNYKERKKTNIDKLCTKTQMILIDINNGMSKIDIAKKHNVSRQWVYSIENVHIKGVKRNRK